MIGVFKKHHPVFVFGILFNRVVPVSIARYRRFGVFELKRRDETETESETAVAASNKISRIPFRYSIADTPVARQQLAQVTGVAPGDVMPETIGVAAESESEIVGGLHLQPDFFYESELGLKMVLPRHSLWLFSAGVRKEQRRQGIYSGLLEFVGRHSGLKEKRIFFSVDLFNRPSLLAHEKHTERELGRYFAIRLFQIGCTAGSGDATLVQKTTRHPRTQPMVIDLTSV